MEINPIILNLTAMGQPPYSGWKPRVISAHLYRKEKHSNKLLLSARQVYLFISVESAPHRYGERSPRL